MQPAITAERRGKHKYLQRYQNLLALHVNPLPVGERATLLQNIKEWVRAFGPNSTGGGAPPPPPPPHQPARERRQCASRPHPPPPTQPTHDSTQRVTPPSPLSP